MLIPPGVDNRGVPQPQLIVRSLVIAIVFSVAMSVSAQERATALGHVHFGESPTKVADAMSAIGLRPYAKAKVDRRFPLDQTFQGTLRGEKVLVWTTYDDRGALEKMRAVFITADRDCLKFYDELKRELTAEYGSTKVDMSHYDYPYDEGDHFGHEQTAIRLGKGHLAAAWDRQDSGVNCGGVALSVEDDLTVRLTYESARWSAESIRRRRILVRARV